MMTPKTSGTYVNGCSQLSDFHWTILSAQVQLVVQGLSEGRGQRTFPIYQLEIIGQVFLYHHVCCMIALLLLIGQEMEDRLLMSC